jgi:SAM-dependent methyltransferase
MAQDVWSSGDAYEGYMGRWSRPVAEQFVAWLAPGPSADWVDVGCGTGALTRTILLTANPAHVVGVDPSAVFIEYARSQGVDERADFRTGDALALPVRDARADYIVSGLVLNFVSDPAAALAEMCRVARIGATISAYVWDYADGMQLMRAFWDAAVPLDPAAAELNEATRFPLCQPDRLRVLFAGAGLVDVADRAITVPTPFQVFDDYWAPFLRGTGTAPGYAASLSEGARAKLRERLRGALAPDGGPINLTARAWAIRGVWRG